MWHMPNHPVPLPRLGWLLLSLVAAAFSATGRERGAVPDCDGWLFLPLGTQDCALLTGLLPDEIAPGTTPSILVAARQSQAPPKGSAPPPLPVWHPARFPHAGFDALNPGRDVFGWYGRTLDLPPGFIGQDLVLHLGVIDDADIAYVNGRPVGRTGDFDNRGSAWNRDREYRIPAEFLRTGPNTVLVRVYDKWGLGGIMGCPVVSAPLVAADERWQVAPLGGADAAWTGTAGDPNLAEALPEGFPTEWFGTALRWTEAALPDTGWNQRQPAPGYGLYRLRFDRPDRAAEAPHLTLDLGPVHDVAAAYLNGKRLGLTGRFPRDGKPAFAETGKRGRYHLSADSLLAKDNDLVVLVYGGSGRGGLPGTPGLLVESAGVDAAVLADAAAALRMDPVLAPEGPPEMSAPVPSEGNPAFVREWLAFDIAVQSLAWNEAEASAKRLRRLAASDPDRARALSALIQLDYLQSLDPGERRFAFVDRADSLRSQALAALTELLRRYPAESVSQSAMQAVCAILRDAEGDPSRLDDLGKQLPGFAEVRYLGRDSATRGDWPLAYGSEGYALAAMGRRISWYGGSGTSCRSAIPGDRDVPRDWLDSASVAIADPRALLMPGLWSQQLAALEPPPPEYYAKSILPGATIRRASWWDDHGEQHAFDELGPDLLVSVQVPAGRHRLSFYCLDPDWQATLRPRQQSVLLTNGDGSFLNAAWTGTFGQGVYERFELEGPRTVVARFLKHRSACVAVSAVFLDPADGMDTPTTAAVPTADAQPGLRLDAGQPLGDTFAAASRFLAAAEPLPDAELRRLLEPVLRRATSPGLAPVRAWTLRLWRQRALPETPLTRHAELRLGHLGIAPAALVSHPEPANTRPK